MILASQARIDTFTGKGWWGTTTLCDLFAQAAAAVPAQEAVVDAPNLAAICGAEPRRVTWAALADEVDAMAAVLHGCGLRRDDILVVQLPNCVDQYVVYFAALKLGLVVCPVPVQYREHELQHVLALTQARAVVACERVGSHQLAAMWSGLAKNHAPVGFQVLVCHAGAAHDNSMLLDGVQCPNLQNLLHRVTPSDIASANQAAADAAITANDIATLCWTSGTEAAPKAVPRSHNEWLIVTPAIIEAARLQMGCRLLNPFPLVNMAGWSTCVAAWLRLQGTVVQHHPFELPVFLQQLRAERIDYTVAPPAILNRLLQEPQLMQGVDFTRLGRIGSGAAPLSEWMVQGFAELGVEIVNYFGSNEGAALTGSPVDIPEPALRAQYFARSGAGGAYSKLTTAKRVTARLVDVETELDITEPGKAGELRFGGPTVFTGYFRAPDLTAQAFDSQGDYKSGDLFEIAGERNQYFRFLGRCKDIVVRGGMNISALEVETMLYGFAGLQDVAVIGVADAILGERVCACVVPSGPQVPELAQLVAFLRDECHVASYKLPERIVVLPTLPRNPVGKVLKRALREQYGG